jgi:hypothetical protein
VLSEPVTDCSPYIARAIKFSEIIKSSTQPSIPNDSPLRRAFDHTVSRDLPSFTPLPVVVPFEFEEAWTKVTACMEGKRLLGYAYEGESLLQWQVSEFFKGERKI